VLAIAAVYGPSTKLHWLFFDTLTNVCIALSVDWAMQNPATTVGRFLNAPAVAFIGVLSYSLYLWQQLFLDRYSTSPLCAFPVNVLLAITMAMISYLCIEAPFLRLRAAIERRPAVVATASSND
jgi:peptidoglycan/LPS O-acetylase OafA/YrhL